jgi:hypothetical protein
MSKATGNCLKGMTTLSEKSVTTNTEAPNILEDLKGLLVKYQQAGYGLCEVTRAFCAMTVYINMQEIDDLKEVQMHVVEHLNEVFQKMQAATAELEPAPPGTLLN